MAMDNLSMEAMPTTMALQRQERLIQAVNYSLMLFKLVSAVAIML